MYLGKTLPPPYAGNVTGPGYTPDNMLATGTTYYWQVIAKHNMCAGLPPTLAGGPIWSFTTSNMSLAVTAQSCAQTWCAPPPFPCLVIQDTITVKGTVCGPVGAYIVPGFDNVDCGGWYKNGLSCERQTASYPACTTFTFTASADFHGQTRTGDITLWDLHSNSVTKSWTVACPACTCN